MSGGKETSKGQGTAETLGGGAAQATGARDERDLDSVRRGLELARSNREKGLSEGDNLTSDLFGGDGGGVDRKAIGAMGPTVKKLLAYAKPVRALLVAATFMAVAGAVLTVIAPEYLSDITDEIEKGLAGRVNMDEVRRLTLISVAILAGSFLFNFVEGLLMVRATQWTARKMRSDLDRKIDRLPLAYFDRQSVGDTLSRVSNDVDTLSQTLNNSVASIVSGVITILGSAIMMFATEWRMALAGIGAALIGVVGSGAIMGVSQKHFVAQQRQLGALNGHIEETYSGHPVVRAFNAEENARQEFHERNDALYKSAWKAQFLSSLMWPLMGFVGNLGYVVVCIVGAVLVLDGTVAVGVIVAFMVYIRIFTNPLGQMAEAATSFQSAAAAGNRVFELLDETEMDAESDKPAGVPEVRGDVDFDHVKFGYVEGQEVIHDFSASVKAGQKVAIVGPTGAGKTTMVNLLMRFYELWGGEIRIDGIPTSSLRREDVDALFSMVLQDTWTFEGTLRENVVYRSEGVSPERLDEVMDKVGLSELVSQLPQGYDSVLSEQTTLSAGQKQLVTIARAMLADNPLLILDEATSSIDTRTEKLIQEALDTLTKDRTSFVIAHRLSTIRNADVIFVMRDGDIVETGGHEELLARGGFYAELYNSQFDTDG